MHALLIQISRKSSIIDIVVPSKMAAAAFFLSLKKKLRIDLKWPEMRSKVIYGHSKWPINLKWPEMRSKVNFGHPKWPTAAILSKISKKNKVAYRSEMARSAIESEFRNPKRPIDLKWPEMRSKVNFGHPKCSTAAILSKFKN